MTAAAGNPQERENKTENVIAPPRWQWWKVIRATDQNVTADIELARIAILSLSCNTHGNCEQALLASCREMLNQCIASQRRLFGNRIFVRQTLFLILQNLILIIPKEKLPAAWLSIRQRLATIDDSEIIEYKRSKAIDEIDGFMKRLSDAKELAGASKIGAKDKIVREKMKEIKSFLDEKVMGELWSSTVLQRQTYILGGLIFCSLSATLLAIWYDTHHSTTPGIFQTTVAGLLGGAISTVSQPSARDSSLPLVRFALIRPLIGAVSGLFLFLISGHTDVAKLAYPYTYAMAIAFGFSERAFSTALGSAANAISTDVSKALGHGTKKPSR